MITHSSVLAGKIPWTEEPGGYSPWGCKESDMTKRLTLTYVYFNSVNIELSLLFICFLLGNNPLLIKLKLPLYA